MKISSTIDHPEAERDPISSSDVELAVRTFLGRSENRCLTMGDGDHGREDHIYKRGMSSNRKQTINATDKEAIKALAILPPLEYERQRTLQAIKLGCRAPTLDRLVEAARGTGNGGLQGSSVSLADVELWPE